MIHNPITGNLDFNLIFVFFGGALFSTSIFFAINTTFYLCEKANLNIGIAQVIWGLTPFFSSILDFCVFKTELKDKHLAGILCMLGAIAWIALS